MSTRIGVAVVAAGLVLYVAAVARQAWLLLTSADAVGVAMGAALVVLPAVAVWALVRELIFGARAAALGRRLAEDGGLPSDDLTIRPSGRVVRSEAESVFPRYRDQVEQDPTDWQAWYRLGLVYDAAGDRRRARQAVREAIRRHYAAAEPES
jgi:cytochrome c-type biogenesis protein CcmH/NrfG